MSNNRKASLQKCMYINEETPHRDPSTIFHSPFNKGAKSGSYNNPSYMSSEVFYPHQKNNLNTINYARTPKRNSISDNNNDLFSNSKSPMKPQSNVNNLSQSKNQAKYSYINDYKKFLDKSDHQSDTKSQLSYNQNSYNKGNQDNGNSANKTFHFGNKSITNAAEVGLPPQPSSNTPKNSTSVKNQLSNIVNQDSTAASYKNRSHSQYDLGDIKKTIQLDNQGSSNGYERSGQQTPNDKHSHKSSNSLSIQNPSSLLKLEQVRNNCKIISQTNKNGDVPSNSYQSQQQQRDHTPQNGNNNKSYTPKSNNSRNNSQVFQFTNQQGQQQQQNNEHHQQQYNDQYSTTSSQKNNSNSKGNFKLIKSPQTTQNTVKFPQTTNQLHYQSNSKSPTPKNFNNTQEIRSFNETNGFQPNQTHARNVSTTPKRVIDLTSNQSTKGSNSSYPISQSGNPQNDRQSNCNDDAKSVASSASYISQLVCNNCVNKDMILDKHLRQQREKERQNQLEKQAIDNDYSNHYNMYMHQHEQNQNARNQYNKEVKEQLEHKAAMKRQEEEREKNQRKIENQQLQEEQERVYRQKLDDLKNYREQYKRDIDSQLIAKQERKEKEKMADQSFLGFYAAQKEQDLHDYMNLVAQKQVQTQKVRDELQNQIFEKKKIQDNKAQEDAKYKQQLEQSLLYDMKTRERQIQERSQELKQFKEAWDQQQQFKQQQKANAQRENDKIKQFQEDQLENDRQTYFYNVEKNEFLKKQAAEDLQMQIDMKRDQKQKEFEEKQQYGKQVRDQYERDLANARLNYHDCDRCHANYPTSHLTKQKQHKSKPKFKV